MTCIERSNAHCAADLPRFAVLCTLRPDLYGGWFGWWANRRSCWWWLRWCSYRRPRSRGHIGGIRGGHRGLHPHFVGGYGYWPYDYSDDAYAYGDCYQTRRYHARTGWHTHQVYVCD